MSARATVIGAGLAGLSAAVRLTEAGVAVRLIEAAAQAGGRCRSYHDAQTGLLIDNGNHLVLSGNRAVHDFRRTVGADPATVCGPGEAAFAFADLRSGERWRVRINDGRLPWWTLVASRRVPGSRASDHAPLLRLMRARGGTVGDHLPTHGPVWSRFVEPVLLAALNTDPAGASARLAAAVLREALAGGGRSMHPCIATPTLAAALIDPALAWLRGHGVEIRLGQHVRALTVEDGRVAALGWHGGAEPVGADEAVVLAVPAPVAAGLMPGLTVPQRTTAIVNAHFAIAPPPGAPPLLGMLGGTAQWIVAYPDRVSVTVSDAAALVDTDRAALAATFWQDIAAALRLDAPMPRWQVVKERRATFAALPDEDARRPAAATPHANLVLAGDWTQTGLPATIEGAIRSGETAAALVLAGGGR